MCGVFAFAGDVHADDEILSQAARAAFFRGPHGHGWASDSGVHRTLGVPGTMGLPSTPRWIVGHARLATFGMPRDESGLQPVTVDGHTLAHNGNVYNWRDLVDQFELDDPATDSWALGGVYAHHRALGMNPGAALSRTLRLCQMKAGAIVIRDASGALVAWRRRLPIHIFSCAAGTYLSSGRFHGARPLPEDGPWVVHLAP